MNRDRLSFLSALLNAPSPSGYEGPARKVWCKGLEGIADEVAVNPAMVHYYFDNKQTLLQNVLERAIEPLADAFGEMRRSGSASLEDLVGTMLNTMQQNPHLPTLVAREVLLPGGVMREHFQTYLAPRIGGAIPALVEREQGAGRIRPDLVPEFSALTLMWVCATLVVARQVPKFLIV